MKKLTSVLLLVAFIALPASASKNLEWSNKVMGSGSIYSVVDGDTIWLNVNEANVFSQFDRLADTPNKKKALRKKYGAVKMRIANINTDESVHRDASRNTSGGKKASDYLKSIASKAKADFICWDHGKYGRPICSVEIHMGGTRVDIGYRMIKEGYSDYVDSWGKHPYAHNEYLKASK